MKFNRTIALSIILALVIGGSALAQGPGPSNRDVLNDLLELLAEQGVDVEQLASDLANRQRQRIEDAIASGRLTQEQADRLLNNLDGRIRALLSERPENPGIIEEVSSALGITPRELAERLRDGATPAQLLTEAGLDVEAAITEIVAYRTEIIAWRVENGQLTQEQADTLLANLEERVTQWVNEGGPGIIERWREQNPGGRRGMGGPGPRGGGEGRPNNP